MDDYTHLADQLRADAEQAEEGKVPASLPDHLRQAAEAIDQLELTVNNYRKALEAMT